MGLAMSILGKFGIPSPVSFAINTVYDKNFSIVTNFDGFHKAFLNLYSKLNAIMPARRYNLPKLDEIKACFEEWKNETKTEEKRKLVENLLRTHTGVSETDDRVVMMTAFAAPAASIVLKRAGENVPALKKFRLNLVPDVVFVPGCTLACLFAVKLLQISQISNEKKPVGGSP